MIEFRMLGSLDLRSASRVPLDRILSQPKRLALLAYLAAATPHGFHRRGPHDPMREPGIGQLQLQQRRQRSL